MITGSLYIFVKIVDFNNVYMDGCAKLSRVGNNIINCADNWLNKI